ncbi:tRNA (adenosine(37)-N6)-dimethylallyltransferase MiaA [candidate division KSB1 bacterium]|nr:tRNA (adenosine(37)-N6)-dimethylallyltransferase MiaA [candidate division KSB1 bacterium]
MQNRKLNAVSSPSPKLPVIVIVGPTASGKTTIAIELANRIQAEIISADSRQFYQMLDIGTAKPGPEELARAIHHFIDFLPPSAEYSAGAFARDARARIAELQQSKNLIVAGGSGMYITALLDGFFAPIARDKALQNKLKVRAEREGSEVLYAELQAVDPERAAELHPNDTHRIVRALEVCYVTGKRISTLRSQPRVPADFQFKVFGLQWSRDELYVRIESRVDAMLEAGLQAEVESLLRCGVVPTANAMQTVGYREMVSFLKSECSLDEAVEKIKQHSRNYAKRQMTWFRKDTRICWLEVNEANFAEIPHAILEFFKITA